MDKIIGLYLVSQVHNTMFISLFGSHLNEEEINCVLYNNLQ